MTGTPSPITDAWLGLPDDIRSRAEEIAGDNRPVTWPEVLLLVGTAIAGERERCAAAAKELLDAQVWNQAPGFARGVGYAAQMIYDDITAPAPLPAAPEIKERIE